MMDAEQLAAGDRALLEGLNEAQQQAVQHRDGPLLILAGPGSGKTRVVTHRIANLLRHGTPSQSVLALTFTNKAADEMRSRVARLAPGQPVWVSTFHSFCARMLRRYPSLVGLAENYTIYDPADARHIMRTALKEADLPTDDRLVRQAAKNISWAKNELITPEQYRPAGGSDIGSVVADVYPIYQRQLLAVNAADFDDLLLHVATILRSSPELRASLDERFRYILVDEFQDTNLAQYVIVRALSVDHPNLAVTGDPDQSIYGWRGATIGNILAFEDDFKDVVTVRLEQNYRSTKNILRAADALIANNSARKEKQLVTANELGRPIRITSYPTGKAESDTIAARIANQLAAGLRTAGDFAIFFRTNALSRQMEKSLRECGVPYQIIRGLEFYQRAEVKDILSYLRLLVNLRDDVACLRAINRPPRQIGKVTQQRLGRYAADRRLPLFDAARQCGLIETISRRSAVAVSRFVALIDRIRLADQQTAEPVVRKVVEESGYRQWLEESDDLHSAQRLENIEELISDARQFDLEHPEDGGLEAFLEQVSLIADADDFDASVERVKLMTLHAAKGLEFPVVHIIAVEEDRLPHELSQEDPDKLEEERRLLFVGITRAEKELYLSYAAKRFFRGRTAYGMASSFLQELPSDAIEIDGGTAPGPDVAPSGREDDFWDEADGIDPLPDDDELLDDHPDDDLIDPPAPDDVEQTFPGMGLRTATELLEGDATDGGSPDQFGPGTIVAHPTYGVGEITSVSGRGKKQTAQVYFAAHNQSKTFRLAFSPLRRIAR